MYVNLFLSLTFNTFYLCAILSLSSIRDHTFGDSLCFNLSVWLVFVIVWPLGVNVVHQCSLLLVNYIYFFGIVFSSMLGLIV